jgi:hypothetical protein
MEKKTSKHIMLILSFYLNYYLDFHLAYYFISVVIKAFSSGEANIFIQMCCCHAKISHSQIQHDTSLLCSASDNPSRVFSAFMDVVDCFNNICIAEFEIIGFQYSLFIKSSISCDIVVIQTPYFLALFTSQNKNSADVGCLNMIHASSHTSNLFFLCDLTFVHMKFNMLNIAGVFKASSTSLILKTVMALLISIFV